MGPYRPDPQQLLNRVQDEEQRKKQGKLKIFLGFAPGVGKTWAMLEAGQALKRQGVDVWVGWVETHGRKETAAQLEGLPQLPVRTSHHRGQVLTDFDLHVALQLRPEVLLLDELAHTNAPGGPHQRRWQDVEELVERGLTVYTTLNVQHLASLQDIVASVTGVVVRETVPDHILDSAAEVELVDIPPDTLLERLREGKVYLGPRAEVAAANFFKRGNLLALREIALRRTAERADADVRAWRELMAEHERRPAGEHLLACVSPSPDADRVVLATRRMAAGLRAPWTVAWVERTDRPPPGEESRRQLDSHLELARSLGAEVVHLLGPDVAEVLLTWAQQHHVTRIVVGRPTHPRVRDRLTGSLLDSLVRGAGEIEVCVVGSQQHSPPRTASPQPAVTLPLVRWIWPVIWVAATTLVNTSLRTWLAPGDQMMLYLLAISAAALPGELGPALLAATLSVLAYDFFFVPPFYTLAVEEPQHLLSFVVLFAAGVTLSNLMSRLRHQERAALAREAYTAAQFRFARRLAEVAQPTDLHRVVKEEMGKVLGRPVDLILAGSDGRREGPGSSQTIEEDMELAHLCLERGRPVGQGTDTLPGMTRLAWPLIVGDDHLGVLLCHPAEGAHLDVETRQLLEALAAQVAQTLALHQLARRIHERDLNTRGEQLKNTLLSGVSHDLRTPLAAIIGTTTTLQSSGHNLDETTRAELLQTILEEAEHMEHLVESLLDMGRLEAGGSVLKCEGVPLEELVGSALERVERELGPRKVVLEIPENLPPLWVDPVLFTRVLVNLFENALRYTPPGTPVGVRAVHTADGLEVHVWDEGPGIPPGMEEKIFERFWRERPGVGRGVGLGLPFARTVISLHGGGLHAHNGPGGGAVFVVSLPTSTLVQPEENTHA